MGLGIELRTCHCRQNAQNFGPELLDQVPGPKNQNKIKVCPNPAGVWDYKYESTFGFNL